LNKLTDSATKFLALLFILSVIVSGCSGSPVPIVPPDTPALPVENSTYWPTEGWRTSTPEEQGMDPQKLEAMLAEIKDREINLHSFLIIRNGYLVSETYFGPYDQDTKHEMQSVGRSWTSALIGIAMDKGYIDTVDQRIVDFFPERTFANMDQRKEAMTLEDVLTMRTGLEWQELPGAFEQMQKSPDWVQYILDRPMIEQPGTRWNYCSICSHVLTAVIYETTGINPRDFAEENLFRPLGISGVSWIADPDGIPLGAGGFMLTPRDMAKLGYLYLRNGQWDGQQIVSSDWISQSTQTYSVVNEHLGYAYHWVTIPEMKGYTASGGGGQIILVLPEDDLVIVTTANTEESIFELIDKYVLPAVQSSE
jgi:CubicO group peptidase (beta-lactamase class C family)